MLTHTQCAMNIIIVVLLAMVMASVDQSYFVRTASTSKLFLRAGQVVRSLVEGQRLLTCPKLSLLVSYVTKYHGEVGKWRPFWDSFVFYSEPANQKPKLVDSGPRKEAKPSVNDKLRSYTVTARLRFGAPF